MNRFVFGLKNVSDKIVKIIDNPSLFKFYFQTYVLSTSNTTQPDIFIVSYPKCGRTWLRILLQKYLNLCGFENEEFRGRSLLKLPDNRVLKFEHDKGNWVPVPCSMKKLSFNTTKYSGKKVIFLVRDPGDVLVSSWLGRCFAFF